MVYIVSEKELKENIQLESAVVEAIEHGFAELSRGNATVPPIMMIPVPELQAEVDIKAAYIKGLPSLAVKVASGFFMNNKRGLPSASGQMLVLNAETGFLQAVLLDNGYLTQVRTGAAGAVAAKYLAPSSCNTVGVIGSGTQARFQMQGLYLMRPFNEIRMWSLDPDDVQDRYVRDMDGLLGVKVIRAASPEEVVKESSVVVTTTPARKPFIQAEWLHPGLHITAMGADTEEKQELFADVFGRADIIACDLKDQVFRLGELRSAKAAGVVTDEDTVTELGEFALGKKQGRVNDNQITVCDLTGVGVQDTVIALRAYELAVSKGLGTQVE